MRKEIPRDKKETCRKTISISLPKSLFYNDNQKQSFVDLGTVDSTNREHLKTFALVTSTTFILVQTFIHIELLHIFFVIYNVHVPLQSTQHASIIVIQKLFMYTTLYYLYAPLIACVVRKTIA